jgi:predicted nucleic acid-binding protein
VKLPFDTSVWSLAFRRDALAETPEVNRLRLGLSSRESVYATGLILQELLQGFHGPRARDEIVSRFAPIPLIETDSEDYIDAADLRDACRRHGVQLGTIDALLALLCLRHDLTMLTTDADFRHAARHVPLRLWGV